MGADPTPEDGGMEKIHNQIMEYGKDSTPSNGGVGKMPHQMVVVRRRSDIR